jgi:hypothetical protein
MNRILLFEDALLDRYTTEGKFRWYIHDYYAFLSFSVLETLFNGRSPTESEQKMAHCLYEEIFDSLMATDVNSFADLNDAIVEETKQVIRVRFGTHSDEYRNAEKYAGYLSIILHEIEALPKDQRVAIKISFIHSFGDQIGDLYREIAANVKMSEKAILSRLLKLNDVHLTSLYNEICKNKEFILHFRKTPLN